MLLEFLLTPITTVHYGLNSNELLAVCARDARARACSAMHVWFEQFGVNSEGVRD